MSFYVIMIQNKTLYYIYVCVWTLTDIYIYIYIHSGLENDEKPNVGSSTGKEYVMTC